MSLFTALSLAYTLIVNPYAAPAAQDIGRAVSHPQQLEERVLAAFHIHRMSPIVIYVSQSRIEKPDEVWPKNSIPIPDGTYINAISSNRYAQPELVEMLASAAREMYEKYGVQGIGPKLEVHDASRKYGGRLHPHASHRQGIDVDVGMYRCKDRKCDNATGAIREWNQETLEANWSFLKSLQYHYTVNSVFWNGRYIDRLQDYVLKEYGLEEWKQYGKVLKREYHHTRHFHLRINNPSILKMKIAREKKPCC